MMNSYPLEKMISFSADYCRLLLMVLLGKRETSYPLSVRWRWRHRNYKDL